MKAMNRARFLHVGVAYNSGFPLAPETLDEVFDKALGWVRYSDTNWILWTTTSAADWTVRVRQRLSPGDHVFICRLDMNERQGWLPRWIWDWMRNPRGG
jgi:hypothetical protein